MSSAERRSARLSSQLAFRLSATAASIATSTSPKEHSSSSCLSSSSRKSSLFRANDSIKINRKRKSAQMLKTNRRKKLRTSPSPTVATAQNGCKSSGRIQNSRERCLGRRRRRRRETLSFSGGKNSIESKSRKTTAATTRHVKPKIVNKPTARCLQRRRSRRTSALEDDIQQESVMNVIESVSVQTLPVVEHDHSNGN